jgi:hypothetical protein
MTVAAGDAHEFCIYAGRFRVVFPLLDADGDLVTGASTPDTERSIDMGTFADCTNEMTEIATSSGMYYIDLTATETTGKHVAVIAKSATAGMKTTALSIPITRLPILRSGTAQAGGASTITLDSGASAKDGAYIGLYVQCSNDTPSNVQGQTRKIISYVGSTKVATVASAWGTNPSSSTTFDILIPVSANAQAWLGKEIADPTTNGVPEVDVTHWIGTAAATPTVAGVPEVDVTHWIGTAAATPTVAGVPEVDVTHFNGTAGTFASGRPEVNTTHAAGTAWGSGAITAASIAADAITAAKIANGAIDAATFAAGAIDATAIANGAIDAATFAAGAIDAAAIAADAIGASELAADAVTEIRSLASGTSDSGSTTTMVDAARTEADTDYWKGQIIVFTSGTIAGQARLITGFTPASDTITFSPATTQTVGTQTYEIWPSGRVDLGQILGADVSTSTAQLGVNTVNAGGTAWGSGAITAGSIAADAITAAKIANAAIDAATFAAGAIDAAAIANGAIDAATFAAGAIDATAIANGAIDAATFAAGAIDAAAVADGAIDAATFAAGAITAAAIATGAIDADALAADAVDEILDDPIEGSMTLRQALRIILSASSGKLAGAATTTVTIRDLADTKDRITATVDASGNRSAVTLDAT